MPDNDLLKAIGGKYFKFGINTALEKLITWFTNWVKREITKRKSEIQEHKPGVTTPSEPKLLWVKAIPRVPANAANTGDVTAKYRKNFNAYLEEAISMQEHNYIVDLGDCINATSYDCAHCLRSGTKIEIWMEINQQIELFDVHKLSLKPNAIPFYSV